jgi:transcriptional regulator with XRE-family HTH domain
MVRSPVGVSDRDRGVSLSRLLADARRRRSMSQEALARAADVSVESVRKIERGVIPTPGFFVIAKICSALSLSMDELINELNRQADGPAAGSHRA